MKFTSATMTKASGSAGGVTASRNKGGMYLRGRANPINRNTAPQQAIRSYVAALATAWQSTLTAAQRAAWATYAANVTKVDSLGASINVSGNNWFLGNNVPRLQGGYAVVDPGPTTFNTSSLTPPVGSYSIAAGHLSIAFTNTDQWATAVGGALLVYISQQQNPTINFFKGPFLFLGSVAGALVAPTSPKTLVVTPVPTLGNLLYVRYVATTADGRLTASYIQQVVVAA